jgi:hypothetical protein
VVRVLGAVEAIIIVCVAVLPTLPKLIFQFYELIDMNSKADRVE